jgi:predicted NUDIX family NTP pyrophosphohydrolase
LVENLVKEAVAMTPAPGSRPRPRSAGLLLYRRARTGLEVLLVHPGGPVWAKRDNGAWSILKGEYAGDEEPLAVARREFAEELGSPPPAPGGDLLDLGEIRQKSGKVVRAWAVAGDLDATRITSNTFSMEWPPRSGQLREFPEVDRAQWFSLREARVKLNPAQVALLDRLQAAEPS